MQPGCPLAGAAPAGSVSHSAFSPSHKPLLLPKRQSSTSATPMQGLALLGRVDASPSSLGIDLHCQKGFSKWFLFVTLSWLFSPPPPPPILETCGLMLRFKSLSAEKCVMESGHPMNTLNRVRDAFRAWFCPPRGPVTVVRLYLGPAR